MTAKEFIKKYKEKELIKSLTFGGEIMASEQQIEEMLETYHKSELEKEVINFFLYFRENGEQNIGMSIEKFVEQYLKNK